MAKRFIPNSNSDFLVMARSFSSSVAEQRERFGISVEETEALAAAVEMYHEKYQAAFNRSQRSPATTAEREQARAVAEKMIKKLAMRIRSGDDLDSVTMINLGMHERVAKVRTCPQEPPRLRFSRALHSASSATPMHELTFGAMDLVNKKPEGAARLELFIDLVSPDAEIPSHPGSNHGGRPWYVRSFTRSPIVLAPPITASPMRVVYWARWADSTGNVGPFSSTAVGWIEGGSRFGLPGGVLPEFAKGLNPRTISSDQELCEPVESTISVTVLQARVRQLNPQEMVPVDRQLDAA